MRRKIRNLKPREKRKIRVKAKIVGKNDRFRLSVFRSNRYIFGQIIDDAGKKTIVAGSDKELNLPKEQKLTKVEKAKLVGQLIAAKAKKEKIGKIVFDRGGNKFHGRVKALAQGAREGGLQF